MSVHQVTATGPVLVGVDGSAASLAAVELAAGEAAVRQRPLWVVHAFIWPLMGVPLGPAPLGPPEGGFDNQARRIVDEAVTRARGVAPDLHVTGEVVAGAPAPVLLRCAGAASMVVIGDRGLGGFTGLLVGSVAVQLAAHAALPVLVVRGASRQEGPILLGVDGSSGSDAAVGFAFEAATLARVPLTAVHTWTRPAAAGPGDLRPSEREATDVRAAEERVLAEALAGWQARFPDVTVRRVVRRGSPRKTLIESSEGARLVVVGARGRGGFTGLLLGSVSQAVLHHARCPVAVVPHDRDHVARPDPAHA